MGAAIVDMCGRGPSGVCLVSDAQLHLPKMICSFAGQISCGPSANCFERDFRFVLVKLALRREC